jgi:hypothetical protein
MGRLIDADALIEVIKNLSYFNADDMQELVASQPTAYDVEKVVAELEEQAEQYSRRTLELVDKSTEAGIHNKGKACSYEHAIDIVKRGGVE